MLNFYWFWEVLVVCVMLVLGNWIFLYQGIFSGLILEMAFSGVLSIGNLVADNGDLGDWKNNE